MTNQKLSRNKVLDELKSIILWIMLIDKFVWYLKWKLNVICVIFINHSFAILKHSQMKDSILIVIQIICPVKQIPSYKYTWQKQLIGTSSFNKNKTIAICSCSKYKNKVLWIHWILNLLISSVLDSNKCCCSKFRWMHITHKNIL